MKRHVPSISLPLFILILGAVYCLTVSIIEFHGVPITDTYSLMTNAIQWGIVSFCTFGVLALLSASKWVFAFTFPVIAIVSGVMCYFNLTIGTRLTPVSIEIAMVNGLDMWWTMISGELIVLILLFALLVTFIIIYRWKYVRTDCRTQLITAIVGLAVTLLPIFAVKRFYAAVTGRLPYSIYYATKEYLINRQEISKHRSTFDNVKVEAPDSVINVIFVLGETLRADHIPMNGYERNTMPLLSADTAVISFDRIYSEYTFTDRSVPHIMTRADSLNPDIAFSEQSFITLFKNAGYKTIWIANQDITDAYTYFAHEADSLIYGQAHRSFYSYTPWLDSDLLEPFTNWYDTKDGKKLAVIHTIGSHWWYPTHYTPEQAIFKPEITHKDVKGLSAEAMINSYDNTIIATDRFLYDIIERIKDDNSVLFFVSDHGEGLGEEGVFLHAADVEPLHRPACLIWYSSKYAAQYPEKVVALRANANMATSTDAIFHTIIELAGLKTPALKPSQSLFYNETANNLD